MINFEFSLKQQGENVIYKIGNKSGVLIKLNDCSLKSKDGKFIIQYHQNKQSQNVKVRFNTDGFSFNLFKANKTLKYPSQKK